MVYYGVNKVTSLRLVMELLPQVYWNCDRINTLFQHIDSDDVYVMFVFNLIPRYYRIGGEY